MSVAGEVLLSVLNANQQKEAVVAGGEGVARNKALGRRQLYKLTFRLDSHPLSMLLSLCDKTAELATSPDSGRRQTGIVQDHSVSRGCSAGIRSPT